ncbi:thiamine-phosphate kinase [Sphingomonas sp.]|uniref:thiamine-phosphate kinase n=1 Tax=Sphingomonas sp. TaxID=28214 RepID=UPI002EDA2B10
MSDEAAFIDLLKGIARNPAARGLMDDAALFVPPPGRGLILTHDMLVEGVHFLSGDRPADVAWKLVAVNLSDLAAKGARPEGMLLGYMLGPDRAWDAAFVAGLAAVSDAFGIPLLGGDTVSAGRGPRALGLTAIGSVPAGGAPARAGATPGDDLWVTGTIGDAGAGLACALAGRTGPAALLAAYHRPQPQIAAGAALVPLARASADVSDGLLIDAARIAKASGCAVRIDLDRVPLSPDLMAHAGDGIDARLAAVTAGDDYVLLIAVAEGDAPELRARADAIGVDIARIGGFSAGEGLSLHHENRSIGVPDRLGYQHGATAIR